MTLLSDGTWMPKLEYRSLLIELFESIDGWRFKPEHMIWKYDDHHSDLGLIDGGECLFYAHQLLNHWHEKDFSIHEPCFYICQ